MPRAAAAAGRRRTRWWRREGGSRRRRSGGACTATWRSRYGSTSVTRLRGSPSFALRFAADADASARLFRHSQTLRDLQVVPVLFEHNLRRALDDVVVMVGQVRHCARHQAQELRDRLRGRAHTQGAQGLLPPLPGQHCRRASLQRRQDSIVGTSGWGCVELPIEKCDGLNFRGNTEINLTNFEPLAAPSYIEVLFMRDPNAGAVPTNVLWSPWAHGRSCLQLTRRKHVLTELSCYAVASDFQKL